MASARIEGTNVRIRTLEETDSSAVMSMLEDSDAQAFLKQDPPHSEDDATAFIRRSAEEAQRGERYVYGVELKSGERLIGVVIVPGDQEDPEAEIGLWLHKEYMDAGYSREVMQVLVANSVTNVFD